MELRLNKSQPENKEYIDIEEIDGSCIGIIHKDKLIDVLLKHKR